MSKSVYDNSDIFMYHYVDVPKLWTKPRSKDNIYFFDLFRFFKIIRLIYILDSNLLFLIQLIDNADLRYKICILWCILSINLFAISNPSLILFIFRKWLFFIQNLH